MKEENVKKIQISFHMFFSYNKREEDFSNEPEPLRAYNDYLEELETIGTVEKHYFAFFPQRDHAELPKTVFSFVVWNLANNIEVDETNRKIEVYKKENEVLIKKNAVKNVRKVRVQ